MSISIFFFGGVVTRIKKTSIVAEFEYVPKAYLRRSPQKYFNLLVSNNEFKIKNYAVANLREFCEMVGLLYGEVTKKYRASILDASSFEHGGWVFDFSSNEDARNYLTSKKVPLNRKMNGVYGRIPESSFINKAEKKLVDTIHSFLIN